jgi:hypothetical protein
MKPVFPSRRNCSNLAGTLLEKYIRMGAYMGFKPNETVSWMGGVV